ncbi:MAG: four helix bundle protein, partial [Acidobacteriota bacterium]|nr:four helix bundle protein [Acidobacteriota bacterium]
HKGIQDLIGHGRQGRLRGPGFAFRGHSCSSCYAPHTKILTGPNSPAQHDTKLASQVSDAASSVPSNISEGFYRFNPAEFANFVKYARGSLQELRTRLPDGVAKRHYSETDIEQILEMAERLARVLGGLYFSLRKQADRKRDARKSEPKSSGATPPRPHRPPKPT